MELFNPKYVRAMWSSDIEGKEVVVSYNIDVMKEKLEKGYMTYATITRSIDGGIGLHDTVGNDWNYAYYDPNLKVKIAFYEGKRVGYSMEHICPDPPDEILHKDTPGDKERLFHVLDYLNPKSTVILDTETYTEEVLKWIDLKIGSVIRKKNDKDKVYGVVGIDYSKDTTAHILVGTYWLYDNKLFEWELADD